MEPLGLLPSLLGAAAVDRAGLPVGRVADVVYEQRTSRPAWILLSLEGKLLHAPARAMRHRSGAVSLVSPASLIRTAPRAAGPPTELTPEHARALSVHYGIPVTPGPWVGLVEPVVESAGDFVLTRV